MSVLVVVAATRAEAAYVPDGPELLVTAVAATARALAVRPDADRLTVVNVGTAGALHDDLEGRPGGALPAGRAGGPGRRECRVLGDWLSENCAASGP